MLHVPPRQQSYDNDYIGGVLRDSLRAISKAAPFLRPGRNNRESATTLFYLMRWSVCLASSFSFSRAHSGRRCLGSVRGVAPDSASSAGALDDIEHSEQEYDVANASICLELGARPTKYMGEGRLPTLLLGEAVEKSLEAHFLHLLLSEHYYMRHFSA